MPAVFVPDWHANPACKRSLEALVGRKSIQEPWCDPEWITFGIIIRSFSLSDSESLCDWFRVTKLCLDSFWSETALPRGDGWSGGLVGGCYWHSAGCIDQYDQFMQQKLSKCPQLWSLRLLQFTNPPATDVHIVSCIQSLAQGGPPCNDSTG